MCVSVFAVIPCGFVLFLPPPPLLLPRSLKVELLKKLFDVS